MRITFSGESDTISPLPRASVAESVVRDFQAAAQVKGVPLFVHSELTGESVRVDRRQLRRVLAYFVGNAIKYTSHGEIRVVLRCGEFSGVEIEVNDSGIGMSKEEVALRLKTLE